VLVRANSGAERSVISPAISANNIAEHNLLEWPGVKLLANFKSPRNIWGFGSKVCNISVRCNNNTIGMCVNPSLKILRPINRIKPPTQIPINSEVA
jgi:hypothetical protein